VDQAGVAVSDCSDIDWRAIRRINIPTIDQDITTLDQCG
jgi:hypothetical protein